MENNIFALKEILYTQKTAKNCALTNRVILSVKMERFMGSILNFRKI